jgi:WD40 repeat protein
MLLALEAVEREPLPEAVGALHRALAESRVLLSLPTSGGADVDPAGRVATTGVEGRIVMWNGATGDLLGYLDAEPWNPPDPRRLARASVLFSPDGKHVAAAAVDGTVRMLDASTGDELWRHEAGHVIAASGEAIGISDMAFSEDGNRFATLGGSIDADQFGTVRVWESESGEKLSQFQASPGGVLIGDGGEIVVASHVGGLSSWNAASGEPLVTTSADTGVREGEKPTPLGVLDLAAPSSGAPLAAGGVDGKLRFGAIESDPIMGARGLPAHAAPVTATAFSPDGTLLATAGRNGVVKVWNVRSEHELLRLVGHVGEVERITFLTECHRSLEGSLPTADEGCTLLTAGRDGSVRLWDVNRTWNREWLTLVLSVDATDVAFMPDGMHFVITTQSQAGIANVTEPRPAPQPFGVSGESVAINTAGDLAAIAGNTGVVLFSLPTGGATSHGPLPVTGRFAAVDFDPVARRLAAAADDGTVYLWDWNAGKVTQLTGIGIGAKDIAFSTDGSSLAAVADDGTARVINVATGDVRFKLAGHAGPIETVLFSSDGRWIITGGSDGLAQMWSSETGALERTMQGHTAGITALSTHGATLATASVDGTAKLWNLESGEASLTLIGSFGLTGIAFNSEGRFLATSASDGTVRVYVIPVDDLVELAQQRVTRSLTEAECQQYLHVDECPPPTASTNAG